MKKILLVLSMISLLAVTGCFGDKEKDKTEVSKAKGIVVENGKISTGNKLSAVTFSTDRIVKPEELKGLSKNEVYSFKDGNGKNTLLVINSEGMEGDLAYIPKDLNAKLIESISYIPMNEEETTSLIKEDINTKRSSQTFMSDTSKIGFFVPKIPELSAPTSEVAFDLYLVKTYEFKNVVFSIKYNKDILELDSTNGITSETGTGTYFDGDGSYAQKNDSGDGINFSLVKGNNAKLYIDSQKIASLKFNIKTTALKSIKYGDNLGAYISIESIGGTKTNTSGKDEVVSEGTKYKIPFVFNKSLPTLLGDINNDGQLTIQDDYMALITKLNVKKANTTLYSEKLDISSSDPKKLAGKGTEGLGKYLYMYQNEPDGVINLYDLLVFNSNKNKKDKVSGAETGITPTISFDTITTSGTAINGNVAIKTIFKTGETIGVVVNGTAKQISIVSGTSEVSFTDVTDPFNGYRLLTKLLDDTLKKDTNKYFSIFKITVDSNGTEKSQLITDFGASSLTFDTPIITNNDISFTAKEAGIYEIRMYNKYANIMGNIYIQAVKSRFEVLPSDNTLDVDGKAIVAYVGTSEISYSKIAGTSSTAVSITTNRELSINNDGKEAITFVLKKADGTTTLTNLSFLRQLTLENYTEDEEGNKTFGASIQPDATGKFIYTTKSGGNKFFYFEYKQKDSKGNILKTVQSEKLNIIVKEAVKEFMISTLGNEVVPTKAKIGDDTKLKVYFTGYSSNNSIINAGNYGDFATRTAIYIKNNENSLLTGYLVKNGKIEGTATSGIQLGTQTVKGFDFTYDQTIAAFVFTIPSEISEGKYTIFFEYEQEDKTLVKKSIPIEFIIAPSKIRFQTIRLERINATYSAVNVLEVIDAISSSTLPDSMPTNKTIEEKIATGTSNTDQDKVSSALFVVENSKLKEFIKGIPQGIATTSGTINGINFVSSDRNAIVAGNITTISSILKTETASNGREFLAYNVITTPSSIISINNKQTYINKKQYVQYADTTGIDYSLIYYNVDFIDSKNNIISKSETDYTMYAIWQFDTIGNTPQKVNITNNYSFKPIVTNSDTLQFYCQETSNTAKPIKTRYITMNQVNPSVSKIMVKTNNLTTFSSITYTTSTGIGISFGGGDTYINLDTFDQNGEPLEYIDSSNGFDSLKQKVKVIVRGYKSTTSGINISYGNDLVKVSPVTVVGTLGTIVENGGLILDKSSIIYSPGNTTTTTKPMRLTNMASQTVDENRNTILGKIVGIDKGEFDYITFEFLPIGKTKSDINSMTFTFKLTPQ